MAPVPCTCTVCVQAGIITWQGATIAGQLVELRTRDTHIARDQRNAQLAGLDEEEETGPGLPGQYHILSDVRVDPDVPGAELPPAAIFEQGINF